MNGKDLKYLIASGINPNDLLVSYLLIRTHISRIRGVTNGRIVAVVFKAEGCGFIPIMNVMGILDSEFIEKFTINVLFTFIN
jgi:hypothetical protein